MLALAGLSHSPRCDDLVRERLLIGRYVVIDVGVNRKHARDLGGSVAAKGKGRPSATGQPVFPEAQVPADDARRGGAVA